MKLLTQIEQETTSQWFVDELASAALDVTERPSQTALVERSAPEGAMPPLHSRDESALPNGLRPCGGRVVSTKSCRRVTFLLR